MPKAMKVGSRRGGVKEGNKKSRYQDFWQTTQEGPRERQEGSPRRAREEPKRLQREWGGWGSTKTPLRRGKCLWDGEKLHGKCEKKKPLEEKKKWAWKRRETGRALPPNGAGYADGRGACRHESTRERRDKGYR